MALDEDLLEWGICWVVLLGSSLMKMLRWWRWWECGVVWCGVASWVQASWRGGDEGNSWHDLSLQYPARPAHTRVHFFFTRNTDYGCFLWTTGDHLKSLNEIHRATKTHEKNKLWSRLLPHEYLWYQIIHTYSYQRTKLAQCSLYLKWYVWYYKNIFSWTSPLGRSHLWATIFSANPLHRQDRHPQSKAGLGKERLEGDKLGRGTFQRQPNSAAEEKWRLVRRRRDGWEVRYPLCSGPLFSHEAVLRVRLQCVTYYLCKNYT